MAKKLNHVVKKNNPTEALCGIVVEGNGFDPSKNSCSICLTENIEEYNDLLRAHKELAETHNKMGKRLNLIQRISNPSVKVTQFEKVD